MRFYYYYIIFLSFLLADHSHRCSLVDITRDDRPEMDASLLSSGGNFFIHYDTLGVRAPNDIIGSDSEYINQVAIAAEYARSILIDTLEYHSEIPDNDGVYDIYVTSLSDGYYGVNVHEGNGTSYIKIDNDYIGGFYTEGLIVMKLTVAHEYFHAIQRWYKESSGTDSYFFELTSTWIEDVIVPDGNDYLYWVDDLFNYPEKDFDSFTSITGYALALYGHYLSTQVQGIDNEFDNTIMRDIWDYIKDGNSALESLKNVLSNYGLSFNETWTDFISRNIYNGIYNDMDNDIYYYIDQSSSILDQYPIDLDYSNISDRYLEFELNDKSVDIYSFISSAGVSITLNHEIFPSAGKIAILSDVSSNNQIISTISNMDIILDPGDEIHFIYGSINGDSGSELEITLNYSIYETLIINLYPNPITSPGYEIVEVTVDYIKQFDNVSYDIIDIRGRIVKTVKLGSRLNGRRIEDIGSSLSTQISSGIYFLRLHCDNDSYIQKFTIYKYENIIKKIS